MRKPVIIESPYRGRNLDERAKNGAYLEEILRHSAMKLNESPYASHRIFPGALDEDVPDERQAGIECGYAWWFPGVPVACYLDRGCSLGMAYAVMRAVDDLRIVHMRYLRGDAHLDPVRGATGERYYVTLGKATLDFVMRRYQALLVEMPPDQYKAWLQLYRRVEAAPTIDYYDALASTVLRGEHE